MEYYDMIEELCKHLDSEEEKTDEECLLMAAAFTQFVDKFVVYLNNPQMLESEAFIISNYILPKVTLSNNIELEPAIILNLLFKEADHWLKESNYKTLDAEHKDIATEIAYYLDASFEEAKSLDLFKTSYTSDVKLDYIVGI